jgi:hypothetical protein
VIFGPFYISKRQALIYRLPPRFILIINHYF